MYYSFCLSKVVKMCKIIFIGFFCIVFHCNTYELCAPFAIQIVIHIGWECLFLTKIIIYHLSSFYSFTLDHFLLDLMDDTWPMIISCMVLLPEEATSDNSISIHTIAHCQSIYSHTQYMLVAPTCFSICLVISVLWVH